MSDHHWVTAYYDRGLGDVCLRLPRVRGSMRRPLTLGEARALLRDLHAALVEAEGEAERVEEGRDG